MRFLFTCGGTAGHIYPAVAVAGRLAELVPGSEFLFIGANGKMEMNLVPKEGYPIKGVEITGISREHNLHGLRQNLGTFRNVMDSTRESTRIIKEFMPDAVIGTGGYVCYPVLHAAAMMHIPSVVHESNAVPGLTTRMLSDQVDRIMVGFEESRAQYHHPERVTVTGTPVRGAFDEWTKEKAREAMGLQPGQKLVLSVWGSLGSGHMNQIIPDLIPLMNDPHVRLLHVTGKIYFDQVQDLLQERNIVPEDHFTQIREFLYDMPMVMAAADVIMCRSGASTLAELSYMGKPSILIPSPNVTNNHQEKNARVLEQAGGAVVMTEGTFDAQSLYGQMMELLDHEERLEVMADAMRSLSVDNAADQIAQIILNICKK